MNSLRMLATDLDGTFIGNEPEMIDLWRSLDEAGVMIVFASGRHLSSIESFYREVGTDRRAAACVTMVGTEIWHRRHGGYVLDESWEGRIAVSWDKAKVGALVAAAVPARLQPDEWQSPLKASYYLEDASESQLVEIRAPLRTILAETTAPVLPRRILVAARQPQLAFRQHVDLGDTAPMLGQQLRQHGPALGDHRGGSHQAVAVAGDACHRIVVTPEHV